MASSPYFDSAGQQIDTSKKALLEAVATGGTAGKQAFDAAQAQAAQAKQEAVARAAERSALYGVGGNDQTFLSAYDARANQGAVNRSNFESGLAQTQASGESYLEKARASIPVLQAININKGADEETKIKLAIQAAKDKAAAELEKEQRSLARTLDAEARAEARAIAREGRSAGRAAAKEAAKPPTAKALLGAGQALADDYNTFLGKGNKNAQPFQEIGGVDSARALAAYKGFSPAAINSIITPQAAASYNKAIELPPTPDMKWLTSNVRGMDNKKAQQALAAPEMTWARDFINDTLAAVELDEDGLIAAAPPGFDGMVGQKPQEAFDAWVRAQKGNLTMKDALSKYYGPTVAAMFS